MKTLIKSKGFTLIELLVVIAIIGILAGIVLVSLSGARNTAKDGRVIADMNQIRSQAQIVELEDDDWADVCADTDITTLIADIGDQVDGSATCVDDVLGTGYCVYVALNESGQYYCVDSTLKSVKTGTNPATAHCNATTWSCP